MKALALILALVPTLAFSQLATNTSAVRGLGSADAAPANVSKLPIRSLLYPGATTKILVRYMGWHGSPKHQNIGYRSDDPAQVRRQVEDMRSRGIDGAIVAWYGPDTQPANRSTQLLFAEAERRGDFNVAISIDTGAFEACRKAGCDETSEFIRLLHYVEQNFESSPAYLRVNGRPLVTSFGLETKPLDWNRIRAEARNNPLFIFRNSGGFTHEQSDGGFSWVAAETASADDPIAAAYLKRFNKAGLSSGKLIMASAYKGFDDSQASWGKGHKIAQNCGETWLATFDLLNQIYSRDRQLPFLLIPTWNDYEEGTEIESGIDNCVSVQAALRGNRLTWDISGSEATIDHFEVDSSADGNKLTEVATVPANARSYSINRVPPNTHWLYVVAIGKPSIRNQISERVAYR